MPDNDILVRPANRDDIAKLLEVLPQITSRPENIRGQTLGLDESLKIFDTIQSHGNIFLLVAVDNQTAKILGTLTLVIVPNITYEGRPWAILENVVVVRECRGQGIGSLMLDHAFGLAEQAQCYKVQLLSGPKDDQIYFYRKAGMTDHNCRGFKKYFVPR